ncbi:hypothetical protein GGR53DRAFT_472108 [Hypoxylon sp. FL1150]|nr:hypothetical protein GGR53DRAFT_472108 [Hypoxylon sp. FL1150]
MATDSSHYFPALRSLDRTPKDLVFGEHVYLHTRQKRYYWQADQVAKIREHINMNTQDPYGNIDDVLEKLDLDRFEGIKTREKLDYKEEILLPKLLRKIREIIRESTKPVTAREKSRPQVSQAASPERKRGALVPESVELIYGALSKLNEASVSLRFIYGELPEDDPITRQLGSLKTVERGLRSLIDNRIDGMTKTWPQIQTQIKEEKKRTIVLDSEGSEYEDDEEYGDTIIARGPQRKRRSS